MKTFKLELPKKVKLIYPKGTITDSTPTYSWKAMGGIIDYQLWVDDVTGNKIQQWYTAAEAGCSSGEDTCSVTPATSLEMGDCYWRAQARSEVGAGDWSSSKKFKLIPAS